MSERSFTGFVTVTEAPPRGMITVRADLDLVAVREILAEQGLMVPDMTQTGGGPAGSVLWMSPDELLVLCDYDDAARLADDLAHALSDLHALVANVSDARAMFRLTGKTADLRNVLAKLTPADLRPKALSVGEVRRTRLAQVPAAFWFPSEDAVQVICFRSVKDYAFELLSNSATEGSELNYF